MIRYTKGPEPRCLVALRTTPGADWNSVTGAQKTEIREALARDQGRLCAYCQQRAHPTEEGMRADHWEARSREGALFAWPNLIGACQGLGPNGQETCDRKRGAEPLFLGPVRGADPQRHLRYLGSGRVEADQNEAKRDIDHLGLNALHLIRGRREAIEGTRLALAKRDPKETRWFDRAIARLRALAGKEADQYAFVKAYYLERCRRKHP